MTFTLLGERFAITRLSPSHEVPLWATGGPFLSITRTNDELSIVCREETVPINVPTERDWRCLKLEGPLPLSVTGVAAEFTSILARAGVSVFVVATYDTDYVLVKSERALVAIKALRDAGHAVRELSR